jgi:hypothetical protein
MKAWGMTLAALMVLSCGCSTFNYEWRREAKKPTPADDVTGRWGGTWLSQTSGHTDPMRCLIYPERDGQYRARFRATYKKVLHFSYDVMLQPKPGTNGVQFRGSADLGKLAGGLYQYAGYATPTNFFSTYDSKYDRGVFQMARPADGGRK